MMPRAATISKTGILWVLTNFTQAVINANEKADSSMNLKLIGIDKKKFRNINKLI